MPGAHQACHPFGVGELVPVSTGINKCVPLNQNFANRITARNKCSPLTFNL